MVSSAILTALVQGTAAFAATNMDDMLLLALYFAQANASFGKRHIVVGQYLGFASILAVSLLGLVGALVLPKSVVALLGIIPIGIGMWKLVKPAPELEAVGEGLKPSSSEIAPVVSVAAVTVANGADNVSIYVPLFANQSGSAVLIIGVFLALVGVWCYAGYRLANQPAIGRLLSRYGRRLMPYVLIVLGASILLGIG
jgi:cadmium resistance protein CadD (predicted permease)